MEREAAIERAEFESNALRMHLNEMIKRRELYVTGELTALLHVLEVVDAMICVFKAEALDVK